MPGLGLPSPLPQFLSVMRAQAGICLEVNVDDLSLLLDWRLEFSFESFWLQILFASSFISDNHHDTLDSQLG